jgi:hypothetical protein
MTRGRKIIQKALLGLCIAAGLLLAAPRDAHAVYKFCAFITPTFSDSNVGEDYLVSGTVLAKWHYMEIRRNGVVVGSGYADSSGCLATTFSTAGNYEHVVFPKIGWSSGANLGTATVFSKPGEPFVGASFTWASLPASTGAAVVTKTINVMGSVLDGLFRTTVVFLNSPSFITKQHYTIYAQVPPAEAECTGCAGGQEMILSAEGNQWLNQKKAVIAHEWGHLIQESLFGFFGMQNVSGADIYCGAVAEATCRCDQVAASPVSTECGGEQWDRLHCLNSREYMFGAFQEGWAHFLAAAMLNDTSQTTAIFPYYKKQIHDNGNFVNLPPVHHQVLPTTKYRWMENECNGTMAGRGTEMDWLSFLYYVNTQTANKYTLTELMTLMRSTSVCNGACTDSDKVTYAKMVQGVDAQTWSAAKKNHFKNNGTPFGVNH